MVVADFPPCKDEAMQLNGFGGVAIDSQTWCCPGGGRLHFDGSSGTCAKDQSKFCELNGVCRGATDLTYPAYPCNFTSRRISNDSATHSCWNAVVPCAFTTYIV